MNCKWICLVSLGLVFAGNVQAVELCGKAAQGEILRGHTDYFTKVISNGKTHRVSPYGEFILAFGRDDAENQEIVIKGENGKSVKFNLKLAKTVWDVQKLKGVPQRKVAPLKADEAAIMDERQKIGEALAKDMEKSYWKRGFIQPVEGRISGNFGGQRVMNGKKMSPHAGMDIAAPEGTEVRAAGDAIVSLNADNLFYSGNVIVLDHGYGLHTIYAHLSEMNVEPGQKVRKGDVIGKVGKTGRVTGPHLHWGASLKGIKFNPMSLLSITNNNELCFIL